MAGTFFNAAWAASQPTLCAISGGIGHGSQIAAALATQGLV
ncbi:hypothetical protein ACFQUU_21910 [Herbaspirillum sp. GCM10030257]